ncbi:site-specific DNA-methyltransferase (plasmid) [Streptomyces seoulensis]|uniref:Methyltransferase n=1 Tax=Streptomyces seoulensis TaxID=73044 RepID=A0A4V1A0G4_STRSO|nr:site-specific DNA-methyltransferase [Streptomyces seoulensis]QBJ94496.1 site-specific DNA-methyltransferase [Streptomyces seoulensis]
MTEPYYSDDQVTLLLGDALETLRTLADASVDCVVTSPPYYGLRSYGVDGQYGLEASPAEYVETMRSLFAEARRVLADDGTLWLNLGDSYVCSPKGSESKTDGLVGRSNHLTTPAGSGGKSGGGLAMKQLLGIPWRVAFALQDDGWFLRNEIIWNKPNAMPESVRDRLSNRHEHLFMLAKQPRYWFDLDSIRSASRTADDSNGRNPGDVWSITTRPYPAAHFAVFPIDLPLRCIKAGCKPGGTVLDPFSGSGTTGAAARQLGRKYIGVDLNPEYHELAKGRFVQGVLDFGGAA